MVVAELTERIEAQFSVGEPTDTYRSVTGDPYVEVHGNQAHDEDEACWRTWFRFQAYAMGRRGKLYWRNKPQLDWNDDHSLCKVYMRCLISDKELI